MLRIIVIKSQMKKEVKALKKSEVEIQKKLKALTQREEVMEDGDPRARTR